VYADGVLLGIVFALLTSVAWAFGNVFVQRSSRRVGAVRAMFWSLVTGVIVALPVAALLDTRSAPIGAGTLAWLLAAGVAGLIAYSGLFYSLTYGQLSLTVPFTSCWSLVAALFGLVVFGERPGGLQLVGAGVVFLGVLMVSIAAGRQEEGATQGGTAGPLPARPRLAPWVAALAAGLGFGVMMPAMNQASPALGNFGTTAGAYILILTLGLPIARALRLQLSPPDRPSWPAVAGAGLFETAGFVLLTLAGRLAPVALAAPVASLASALTIIYAFIFLRERPGAVALAGALLASVGVVFLAVK
jgi:drug/metabolite transporter (DMT)-like permease